MRSHFLRRGIPSPLSLAACVSLIGLVTACSAGATPTPASSPSAAGSTVKVTLQEWAVVPASTSAPAGSTTFDVTNNGPADPHEFVVFKTDLDHRSLPTKDDGSVDEEGAGVELIGEIEEFEVGATMSQTFDLTAGKYVFICNLVEEEDGQTESHYQQGMSIAFTVS
jgi:uncharacterized cupredoxin-like copper-binding protein